MALLNITVVPEGFMGEQFVNYQIRSDSQTIVVEALQQLSVDKCYVSPPSGGWISIYDKMSEDFRNPHLYDYILNFASFLSKTLRLPVFIFIVFSGLNFLYFAFDDGVLIDEFYDDPENGYRFGFDKFDICTKERFQGCPEKIVSYFKPNTLPEEVASLLSHAKARDNHYLGEDVIYHLAPLMGLDECRSVMGFKYLELELIESNEMINDFDEYALVEFEAG
jgi:hypothetical protein